MLCPPEVQRFCRVFVCIIIVDVLQVKWLIIAGLNEPARCVAHCMRHEHLSNCNHSKMPVLLPFAADQGDVGETGFLYMYQYKEHYA